MKTLTKLPLALLALLMLFSLVACADIEKTGAWQTATYDRDTELGEGAKTVTVKVVADGQELTFTLHTDKENLEDALVEHNLIDGDVDVYGMYIKKVNGIVADYDTDKTYWAITKSGEDTLGAKSTSTMRLTIVFFIISSSFRFSDTAKRKTTHPPRENPRGARQNEGVGTSPVSAIPPITRGYLAAQDGEHSDWGHAARNGNGCCDGFAPYFPHPRKHACGCAMPLGPAPNCVSFGCMRLF